MNTANLMVVNGQMLSLESKGDASKLNASVGDIVAHDLLEHPEGQTRFYFQEVMAAGGSLFVRGDKSYFSGSRLGNVANIAGEMLNISVFFKLQKIPSKFFDESLPVIQEAKELMEVAISMILTMYQGMLDGSRYLTRDERVTIPYLVENLEVYRAVHERMVTEGFNIAKKRFGNQETAAKTFINIEEAVNRFLDKATPEMEGQKFVLSYSAEGARIMA